MRKARKKKIFGLKKIIFLLLPAYMSRSGAVLDALIIILSTTDNSSSRVSMMITVFVHT